MPASEILTIITQILLPIVLGGNQPGQEIEHPMALVILGGLISSALLNLLVIPAVFWKTGRISGLEKSEVER